MSPDESAQEVLSRIDKVWAGEPEREICAAIFDFLVQNFDSKTIFLSEFRSVAETAGHPEIAALLGAISYLGGAELHLIELRYEYCENDFDVVELDRKQASAALKRSINPISGEVELGVAERILTHYRPTQELIRIATTGARNA